MTEAGNDKGRHGGRTGWAALLAAAVLLGVLVAAVTPAMRGGATLAFGPPAPDQSTGPYNPNPPQGDLSARGWTAS